LVIRGIRAETNLAHEERSLDTDRETAIGLEMVLEAGGSRLEAGKSEEILRATKRLAERLAE
jgi:hypothetical protein